MNLSLYGFGTERRQGVARHRPRRRLCGRRPARHRSHHAGHPLPAGGAARICVGLVLTHAHEDHYGALIDLWPRLKLPLYATPVHGGAARGQAPVRARRARHSGQRGAARRAVSRSVRSTSSSSRSPIRSRNRMHSSFARRSVPCCTPATGRLDPTPLIGPPTEEAKLRALGDAGCLAVVGDSTNAVRDGRSPSETRRGASASRS